MITYPIPEYLAGSHEGNEWAIAAILEKRVVALLYIADLAPDITHYLDSSSAEFVIKRWVQTNPKDAMALQALGNVSAGLVTANGFTKRWALIDWKPCDQCSHVNCSEYP
jgi:hypothetical protein